jgi:hypothetical protein
MLIMQKDFMTSNDLFVAEESEWNYYFYFDKV